MVTYMLVGLPEKPATVRRAKQIKLQKLKCKQFVGVRLQLLLLVAIATPSSGAPPPPNKIAANCGH